MEYKDLERVNKEIRTTNIKGKEYAEVNQRIKAFRMVYPMGFILPHMISNENGICIFEAEVGYYKEDGAKIILASGTAYEKENSTFINKTSYIENCETSAVGRALGMCGFGIDTSVASAEEVQNAINNQGKDDRIDLMSKIQNLSIEKDIDLEEIKTKFKVDSLSDMTTEQMKKCIVAMERKQNE